MCLRAVNSERSNMHMKKTLQRMIEESKDKECFNLELNYILKETERLEQILKIE